MCWMKETACRAWKYLMADHSRQENLLLMLVMLLLGLVVGLTCAPDRVSLVGSCNGNGNDCSGE